MEFDDNMKVITACVIMHNIIMEDEHGKANQFGGCDFEGAFDYAGVCTRELEAYLEMLHGIYHRGTHEKLQVDFIEHI
jgi:hypothetical protein